MTGMWWCGVRRGLAVLTMASVAMIAQAAYADPIDMVQKLAPSASSNSAVAEAGGSGPLGKFSANGRVTETLSAGACPGSLAASVCSGTTNCDQINISGPLVGTGMGAANLSACLTVDNQPIQTANTTLEVCFQGLGNGTITAQNGNSVLLAFSGDFCVGDEFPLPTPTSIIFETNAAYSVESGTGRFANAVGNGNLTSSLLITAPTTPPLTGTGTVSLTGNFAKK